MATRTAGAATLRRVGLIALEALLVAALVWMAAMTLGAQGDGGFAGIANAGRGHANLTVPDGVFGGTTTAHANPGGDRTWVHAVCMNSDGIALTQWVRVDADNNAILILGPTPSWTSGGASCTAEEGYFSNGRWRVQAKASFSVAP